MASSSSSHIPPLSTFRTNQSSSAKRSRRFPPSHPASHSQDDALGAQQSSAASSGQQGEQGGKHNRGDAIVQATDNDALASRLSAIQTGYLIDPFALAFATSRPERRFPIINRGTYVRSTSIDLLMTRFLSGRPGIRKQVISLGAGSDSRYWRLATSLENKADIAYHEFDFPAVTARKIATISKTPLLREVVENLAGDLPVTIDEEAGCLFSKSYNIHPIDLRELKVPDPGDGAESSNPLLNLPNIDPTTPTLLLSECCLIYLPPQNADAILKFFTSLLFPPSTPLGIILYEPTNPLSPFGKVMVSNLAQRGIVLQTLKRYSSLSRQKERLKVMGFTTGQGAVDNDFIWNEWVPIEEKARIGRLEMMDEVEEWRLLASHYCTAWAWRDGDHGGGGGGGDDSKEDAGDASSWFTPWIEGLPLQKIPDDM